MSILVCITMISVGFSSWVTLTPGEDSSSGQFAAYPVYESAQLSDYVSTKGMTMFHYSSLSFTDVAGKSLDYGDITVVYSIDVAACAEVLGSSWNGNLTLDFSLWYSNITDSSVNLFTAPTDGFTRSISVLATYGSTTNATVTPTSTANGKLDASVSLSGLAGVDEYSVTVTFRFNIPQNMTVNGVDVPANFRNAFGKYIKAFENEKTSFTTSATVREVDS
jgi:hypothetical protein